MTPPTSSVNQQKVKNQTGSVRLGSLHMRLHVNDLAYAGLIEAFFRINIDWNTSRQPAHGFDFDLSIMELESLARSLKVDNQLVIVPSPDAQHYEVHTDIASGVLDTGQTPGRISIQIDSTHDAVSKHHHFRIVFFRILYLLGRVMLHAAAVRFRDKTHLFAADKGSGKSTLTLALALNGGTVLGEDHVLIRQSGDRFTLSGCDEKMRLTADSEQHFFAQPLPVLAADYAGILKKEIRLSDYVSCSPYQDFPIDTLFFPVIGQSFHIESCARQEAMQRLMRDMPWFHRFTDISDQMGFIDYFADLVESVEPYHLTLSPDLSDLSRLTAWLEEHSA